MAFFGDNSIRGRAGKFQINSRQFLLGDSREISTFSPVNPARVMPANLIKLAEGFCGGISTNLPAFPAGVMPGNYN